jgi:hypothetical protein
MEPTPVPIDPVLIEYLLGPLGCLVLALIWVWRVSRENTDLRTRNAQLSDFLIDRIESASRERVRMIDDFALRQDSSLRNVLDVFTALLPQPPSSGVGTRSISDPPQHGSGARNLHRMTQAELASRKTPSNG